MMTNEQNNDDSNDYNDHQSPNGTNQSDQKDDDICRDYLRNVCRRGGSCRYRHPDEGDIQSIEKAVDFVFCHDYQNRECRRANCRFVHATKQEEETFRSNGKLPQHVMDRVNVMKGYGDLVGTLVSGNPPDSIPICKDFLKGECRRGQGRCKFRHLTQREADMELGLIPSGHGQGLPGHHGPPHPAYGHIGHPDAHGRYPPGLHAPGHHPYGHPPQPPHLANGNHHVPYSSQSHLRGGHALPPPQPHLSRAGHYGSVHPSQGLHHPPPPPAAPPAYPPVRGYGRRDPFCDPVYVPPEKKARTFDLFGSEEYPGEPVPGGSAPGPPGTSRVPPGPPSSSYALEDENAALRRRVEDLKKQVADLMATNDFLLEQNAQLRSCAKNGPNSVPGSVAVPTVTPGTVTALAAVTSGPPGSNGQVVTPVGVTTATVELPVVSIASLSAVTGLPVSSIAASLSNAIISTSTAVTSGVNSLVTYPHIVATSAALKTEYHNSLTR